MTKKIVLFLLSVGLVYTASAARKRIMTKKALIEEIVHKRNFMDVFEEVKRTPQITYGLLNKVRAVAIDSIIDTKDFRGFTLLHEAATRKDSWDLIEILIKEGSNGLERTKKEWDTPLHLAVKNHSIQAIGCLWGSSALGGKLHEILTMKNKKGKKPFDHACEDCPKRIGELRLEAEKIILKHELDIIIRCKKEMIANAFVVLRLLDSGSDDE